MGKKASKKSSTKPSATHLAWERTFQQGGAWGFYWIGIVLLIFVFYITYTQWSDYEGQLVSQSKWAKAPGVITQMWVKRERGTNKSRGNYRAEVRYSYQVNGVNYKGYRIGFGYVTSPLHDVTAVRNVANKYPVGKPVTVHFLPWKPQVGVLDLNDRDNAAPIVNALIAILGIASISFGYWGKLRYKVK